MANLRIPHNCCDAAGAMRGQKSERTSEMNRFEKGPAPLCDFDFSEGNDPPFVSRQVVVLARLVPAVRCCDKQVTISVWVVPAPLIYSDADGECGHRM
jgi:hypothetical protein